jgi:hypothetical protein
MLKVKLYLSLQIFDTVISLVLVVLYSVGNCSRHCNTNPLEQEPKATGLQMKNKKTPNQRAKCMLIFNPEATPFVDLDSSIEKAYSSSPGLDKRFVQKEACFLEWQ